MEFILVCTMASATVDENNIDKVEQETFEIVNKTISSLESAIANFDNAKKKPEQHRKKIERLRELHEVLFGWARDFLMRPKEEDFETRIERLREFTEICRIYG